MLYTQLCGLEEAIENAAVCVLCISFYESPLWSCKYRLLV